MKTNVLTFEVGQSVTCIDAMRVPKGTVGVITRLCESKSEATVTFFPNGSWKFPFKKLKASSGNVNERGQLLTRTRDVVVQRDGTWK